MNAITDLNDLRLFSEVVEHGSYTAAARSLGLQTSKLSRRIRALEEELGVRLLNRTSRSLSLTETGRQFHQHCLALVAEAKAAKDIVDRTRSKPQGTVRIACAVALLESGISTMIARYIQENPDVQVLLDATNRRVDVVEEGLDFAIRVRIAPLENTDLAVRQLGLSIRILVDAEGRVTSWAHQPRLATDDLASLRVAALSGVGVAMLPKELVEADIQAGRLQHLLPGLASTPGLVHAIFPTRRGMVPAVRHLLDALVAGFEDLNRQR